MTLELIGMLDSPYVRRTAVGMHLMRLPFAHRPLSVFRDVERFREINPVVKAPTLVTGDGCTLMDSSLILAHLEADLPPQRRLTPAAPARRLRALRRAGLALAACEKTVQIVYERNLRPAEKQHLPWLDRVARQLAAAYRELERDVEACPLRWENAADGLPIDIGGLSAAVAWYFTQQMLPGAVAPEVHPRLAAWSALAEQQPAFRAAPHEG